MLVSALLACVLTVLPLSARAGQGGPAPRDEVDAVIEAAMTADGLPGVSLVVGRAGAIVKQAAYGDASVEPRVPATLQTVYPIASATKSISSTAIFLLVGAGKFSLEDSIVELLPDLPDAWLEVTVRHLLTHTSGLPDIAITPGREPLIAASRDEALAKLRDMPCAAAGARWSYNQTNYMLVQMLVERYGERPFETFVHERIFAPLELEATTFGDSDDDVPGRASMYERRDGVLRPRESRFPDFVRAAAGVNTTVVEWYRFADAWAHGRILPLAQLAELWRPAELASGAPVSLGTTASYGCGVALDMRNGRRSAGHSGGGNAVFRYFIDEDMLVVLASNGTTDPDALVERIAAAVRSESAK
jgi:CubicO group peptidase (beta-lactamase class C family)